MMEDIVQGIAVAVVLVLFECLFRFPYNSVYEKVPVPLGAKAISFVGEHEINLNRPLVALSDSAGLDIVVPGDSYFKEPEGVAGVKEWHEVQNEFTKKLDEDEDKFMNEIAVGINVIIYGADKEVLMYLDEKSSRRPWGEKNIHLHFSNSDIHNDVVYDRIKIISDKELVIVNIEWYNLGHYRSL